MITTKDQEYWYQFVKMEHLNQKQEDQFACYMQRMLEYNQHTNITRITEPSEVVWYHFQDSLALGHSMDMNTVSTMVDVGTGAGFPGIPLKIKYPHLNVTLLEVNEKKVQFLEQIIEELQLDSIEVNSCDWRTFVRTNKSVIDLVCARASLEPLELTRIFTRLPNNHSVKVVYWASVGWEPTAQLRPYIANDVSYTVGQKTRRLIFLHSTNAKE